MPFLLEPAEKCPGSSFTPPCPEAIAAADVGTMSVNYRNEPIALRVRDPATNKQAAGLAGNLSHVYRSNVLRADGRFNLQPNFYPPLTADVQPGDPFTPLLRAYEDDPVQIRILVGAHEEGHNFGVNGIKWKFEPSDPNSGFRNNQMMGISEHFEFVVPKLPHKSDGKTADLSLSTRQRVSDDQWNGLWGLMRVYATKKVDLLELPNNPKNNTLDWTNQGRLQWRLSEDSASANNKSDREYGEEGCFRAARWFTTRARRTAASFTIRRRSCTSARKISIPLTGVAQTRRRDRAAHPARECR